MLFAGSYNFSSAGTAGQTKFLPFFGASLAIAAPGFASELVQSQNIVPNQCSTAKLYIQLGTAPGSGNSYTYTLRNAGANTVLSCTVSGTNTTCNDSQTLSIAAGSLIDLQTVAGGTPSATNLSAAFSCQ